MTNYFQSVASRFAAQMVTLLDTQVTRYEFIGIFNTIDN